jgi:hypothetical protein
MFCSQCGAQSNEGAGFCSGWSDCQLAATVKFNDEICFVDGQFVRYPQGFAAVD